jgi:hypothetical protein
MLQRIFKAILIVCIISMLVSPAVGATGNQTALSAENSLSLQGWLDTIADLLHQIDQVLDNLFQVLEHFSESGESEAED